MVTQNEKIVNAKLANDAFDQLQKKVRDKPTKKKQKVFWDYTHKIITTRSNKKDHARRR